ncbi:MAG TPA: glycine--tRNA ligase subunit beta [Vicinamibacterales bacterium]|nr:glycine--tRNA ligase subunit beta [Vicinamibacterales bacterium]
MDRELLIEIGVEELPASWMPDVTRRLAERVEARMIEHRIAPGAPIETFSTPRRLTARIARIAERQEDLDETITGPPVSAATGADGQPTPAALGFARKHGVSFEGLSRVRTQKGEYLAVEKRHRGRSAVDTLPSILTAVLRDLTFPKQMHWDAQLEDGRGELLFGRPIRWLLFLYGGRVVPFRIGRTPHASSPQVQDVESAALTYGHRFLATSGRAGRSIKVRSFEEYQARLAEHFVVLEHADRRDRIARDLEIHARRLGGRVLLKEHAALIEEVADLVEYPSVVAGFFDRAFLTLPEEILTTTLVHHQHFFPVVDERGDLKEAFLAVVNTQPQDERVIGKNAERVVTARLRDAKFFWESDRKVSLQSRLGRLHTVLFHKKLGSYRDKAERIEQLARWMADDVFGRPREAGHAATAGRLCKADLTSDMVFEFPELQGRMGGIYAREEGQPAEVWKAIYHHYLPISVEADAPPARAQLGEAAVAWAAVSLADKLDTVAGLTRAGERPTGSRDPFGLRRQMHGIARVLMDLPELAGIDREVGVGTLLNRAAAQLDAAGDWDSDAAVAFALDRVRYALEQRGMPSEVARAAASSSDVSPLRALRVATALQAMRSSEDFQALAVLFKRVKNIARGLAVRGTLERSALTDQAELALLAELDARRPRVAEAQRGGDYRTAFTEISGLRSVVDAFFTHVFVMADDERLRTARLTLTAELRDLILELADISEIVPQTE